MEGGTLAVFAFEPNCAALHFHQAFGDVQTQTGAGRFTSFWVLRAEKFLENFLLIFKVYADPAILDPDMNDLGRAGWIPLVNASLGGDFNLPTLRRVFIGITHQVDQYLSQACAVCPNIGQFAG